MANKIALLLLGGIVVTAATAGAAIGVYVGDGGQLLGDGTGGGSAAPTPTVTPATTATPTATSGGNDGGGDGDGAGETGTEEPGSANTTPPPTSTATPAATATRTPEGTPTPGPVRPDSLNETKIQLRVIDEINDRRVDRGLQKLRPHEVLTRMAVNHSQRMSEQGYVSHSAGGFTTEERYRRNDMYDVCTVQDDTNTGLRDGEALETLDKVSAGGTFDNRTNRNEREIAQDAVENWFAHEESRRKLTYENARQLGAGVHVSGSNRAYVTVDLCS
ncbi:CAP domain-containing protein [Haloglomus litoreum]|uniref:CAP domain-containing protein n=1 Tax=Haloglomus litoreum TaxID=3034026 RepID=UPI0023E7676C|nr:CAP domain-containing protein [Haloglomus sp. DT116]